jgi:hypothetical protein
VIASKGLNQEVFDILLTEFNLGISIVMRKVADGFDVIFNGLRKIVEKPEIVVGSLTQIFRGFSFGMVEGGRRACHNKG